MELSRLQIRHLATVEELDVDFSPGFNVLTGETGAGKSILVDGIKLLLGGRGDSTQVRKGMSRLRVEGVLTWKEDPVRRLLESSGMDEEGSLLMIRREVAVKTQGRTWVNQSPVTLKFLQSLLEPYVTVHGQSDQLMLTTPAVRRELLDGAAGQRSRGVRLAALVQEIRNVEGELTKLRETLRRSRELSEELTRQRDEIRSASLYEGEEEELRGKRARARDQEAIVRSLSVASNLLSGSSAGLLDFVAALGKELETLRNAFSELGPSVKELEGVTAFLSELAVTLDRCMADMEEADIPLEKIEDRLAQIETLKRKYGPEESDIFALLKEIEGKLASLGGGHKEVEEREKHLAKLLEQYAGESRNLSRERKKAAAALSREVTSRFSELDMADAVFRIDVVREGEEPKPGGNDRVDFMVAPNPGEGCKPLEKIASGGELSRIQLALMTVLSSEKGRVYVFDEIDQGIGGATARHVGRMLRDLSGENQVFAVTHLPQVAAFAHHHYHLTKEVVSGRTRTRISLLAEDRREEILARMISGKGPSAAARKHAKELLNSCRSS